MANYIASCRSNYFKVKDLAAFEEDMSQYEVTIVEKDDLVGILGNDPDGGGWPSYVRNEETEDYDDVDFPLVVAAHLTEDSIAVFIEAGAEKLRYVCGNAVAFNHKGEAEYISLYNIYDKAEQRFGIRPTPAEY